jgi:type I restriction enzyme, S subunit
MKRSKLSTAQDLITEAAVKASATSLIDAGSVLMVTRSGILSHSLPVAVNLVPVALNQDIKAVTPSPATDGLFLWFAFKCFERDILNECRKGGTTVHSIEFPSLLEFPIPLPPLAEQRRIVAKIEELFSELDAGEESLRRARRQLGVYRQSLLKQAFEGKLTSAWRKQNPHLLESPDQLLGRIHSERQARYSEELKGWEAAGRSGSKPKKPPAIHPFAPADLVGNPVVPDAWLVMTYGDLCSLVRNGISQKPSGAAGHKIARISAVRPMAFDLQDYRFLDCDDEFASDYTLRAGDLVFTRYNGARRFVGVCARFPSTEPRLYPDKLIRTCPDLPSLDPRFLEIALNTGLSRAWLETKIRTTAGQSGVSGGDVKAMPVPICSLPEQQEIVRLLDEQFTVIEQNEREIDAALKRSVALRQSILKKAFTGQLIPQDPTDEPASALLERIRKERETTTSKPPKKSTGHKRASRHG